MHFLLTGHTGFKGSWMTMLLAELGHTVSGVALDPEPRSLFVQARVQEMLTHDVRSDIRDPASMREALETCAPDVLVHMAAQPLVRESYRDPRGTVETNVVGTMNVLDAASLQASLQAQLIVTTDKVYRNVGHAAGYREDEPLGGDDPYSASKAMADILTQSWVASFPSPPTAVARAGNVIGGGDYSRERLVPDLIAALTRGDRPRLRYPGAIRPWQHVLDCLNGYLEIVRYLTDSTVSSSKTTVWNVGPGKDSFVTVGEFSSLIGRIWGDTEGWELEPGDHPEEAEVLALDASKARDELGWHSHLDFEKAVTWTVDWYLAVARGEDARRESQSQIHEFLLRTRV
jgi:CDP-glucose 4,6-dehydratase